MKMGVNKVRGDVALMLDGKAYRLRLTFGALAEIEEALDVASLGELATRLRALSAADMVVVLEALLRGAGEDEAATRVRGLHAEAGEVAAAIAAAFREAFA